MYHYTESGLQHVWLKSGYAVRRTPYGKGIAIQDVAGLHKAICSAIARKPSLTGAELRFLRKEMGMSQHGLGELLGVTGQTVALWERKGRLPKSVDRLLRLIYVEHDKGNTPIADFLCSLNELVQQDHECIIAEEKNGRWKIRLAA